MRNDLPKLAKKLSRAYGCHIRLVGPYLCKDGRRRIDVKGAPPASGLNKTIQLARARLEVMLDRPLRKGETVDHIDDDKTNDRYSNLQLLSHQENAGKHSQKQRRASRKASRTVEARLANSLRSQGELNSAAKVSNKQARLLRKEFDRTRDFHSLLEFVPFGRKSLISCLSGKTYTDAGGPVFRFAPRSAGRGLKQFVVLSVRRRS